jgi:hypothetical protein
VVREGQENDGGSLVRAKLTVRKRVRNERRIVTTKAGGLLTDPRDVAAGGPKVPAEQVVAAVAAQPGVTLAALGAALNVSKDTAANYVKALGTRLRTVKEPPKGTVRVYLTSEPPNTSEQARFGGPSVVDPPMTSERRTASMDRRSASKVGGTTDLRAEAVRILDDLMEPEVAS